MIYANHYIQYHFLSFTTWKVVYISYYLPNLHYGLYNPKCKFILQIIQFRMYFIHYGLIQDLHYCTFQNIKISKFTLEMVMCTIALLNQMKPLAPLCKGIQTHASPINFQTSIYKFILTIYLRMITWRKLDLNKICVSIGNPCNFRYYPWTIEHILSSIRAR